MAPLLPLLGVAVIIALAIRGPSSVVKTSPFYVPISPDVPPGDSFFTGPFKTTPLVNRSGLKEGQFVTAVLELPLAGPRSPDNPHVLALMRIVTTAVAGGPEGTSTAYGLQLVRVLGSDAKVTSQTPRPDKTGTFTASPTEIAQVTNAAGQMGAP